MLLSKYLYDLLQTGIIGAVFLSGIYLTIWLSKRRMLKDLAKIEQRPAQVAELLDATVADLKATRLGKVADNLAKVKVKGKKVKRHSNYLDDAGRQHKPISQILGEIYGDDNGNQKEKSNNRN